MAAEWEETISKVKLETKSMHWWPQPDSISEDYSAKWRRRLFFSFFRFRKFSAPNLLWLL